MQSLKCDLRESTPLERVGPQATRLINCTLLITLPSLTRRVTIYRTVTKSL